MNSRSAFAVVIAAIVIVAQVKSNTVAKTSSPLEATSMLSTSTVPSKIWNNDDGLRRHDQNSDGDDDGAFKMSYVRNDGAKALDVGALDIHHAMDSVNALVGLLGGSASSLVVELTGISLTDCALSFNGVDVSTLSCEDFLDILSTCDSLTHVKPLFKSAKKKLRHQHVPTNRPCSKVAHH